MLWPRMYKGQPNLSAAHEVVYKPAPPCLQLTSMLRLKLPTTDSPETQKRQADRFFCVESRASSKAPGRLKRKGFGACRGLLRICLWSHFLFTTHLAAPCPHHADFRVGRLMVGRALALSVSYFLRSFDFRADFRAATLFFLQQ